MGDLHQMSCVRWPGVCCCSTLALGLVSLAVKQALNLWPLASPAPTGGGGGKRQRATSDVQRPRTDWQKKDDNTWYKVVPPWWCEHRTVHFASECPCLKEWAEGRGSAAVDTGMP